MNLLVGQDFLKRVKASIVKLLREFLITIAEVVIKPSPFQPGIKNSDGLKVESAEAAALSFVSPNDEIEKAFS
jgi:hypothetical protein